MPLTGELCPFGPGVVDASKSEAPQPFIKQLPVADAEAQEDTVDLVLGWWLQGNRQDIGSSLGLLSSCSTLSPHHAARLGFRGYGRVVKGRAPGRLLPHVPCRVGCGYQRVGGWRTEGRAYFSA